MTCNVNLNNSNLHILPIIKDEDYLDIYYYIGDMIYLNKNLYGDCIEKIFLGFFIYNYLCSYNK